MTSSDLIIMIVLSIIIGGAIGTILSLATWTKKLSESNNLGDSCGELDDYTTGIVYFLKKDWVDRNEKNSFLKYYGRDILKEQGINDISSDYSFNDDVIPDDEELPEVDIPLFKPL